MIFFGNLKPIGIKFTSNRPSYNLKTIVSDLKIKYFLKDAQYKSNDSFKSSFVSK